MAYTTAASGHPEVLLRPFPDVTTGRIQVSNEGGTSPLWSRDGSTLYYVNGEREVVAAEITSRAPLRVRRRTLFSLGRYLSSPAVVTSGGEFLVRHSEPEIVLVLNWTRLLE
ncbi:MAG: hypothetical protein R3304_11165 [Longimicrobiales bacterium]|nr:hypothetical protein [Longimicrobiales bacterium]